MSTDISNFIIHLPFFSKDECKEIVEYIDKKEIFFKNRKYQYNKEHSEYDSFITGFYDEYNFLKENKKYIPKFKKILKENFPELRYPIIVQSWCNLYKKDEGIRWHTHDISTVKKISSITANIFVGGRDDIGVTYAIHDVNIPKYRYINVKNKLGHIQFLPSYIYHMVRPNPYDEFRYTIGITITEFNLELFEHISKSYPDHDSSDILVISNGKDHHKKTNFIYQ